MRTRWLEFGGLFAPAITYAPVSGSARGPKSLVSRIADLARDGTLQGIVIGWPAVATEPATGDEIAWTPGPPRMTLCTLSLPRTTSSRKSPEGKLSFVLKYSPEPAAVSGSVIVPIEAL